MEKIRIIKKAWIVLLIFLIGAPAFAQLPNSMPVWFYNDVLKQAPWLPVEIRQWGLDAAFQQRWATLPPDVQVVLTQAQIPTWMIALIPSDPTKQEQINNDLRGMLVLAGNPVLSAVAARAEQLLVFGGSAQLPTPGDARTGFSLGPEGCTAAMSRYILAELKIEFPQALAQMSDELTNLQSSVQLRSLVVQAYNAGATWLSVQEIPFADLQNQDVPPGSLMIAQKTGGTHVFGWTRVPSFWRWAPSDKMAVGNTGLPQYGDRMILAQEFLTNDRDDLAEFEHNPHGPINSRQVLYIGHKPATKDPRTNVYAAQGSRFFDH